MFFHPVILTKQSEIKTAPTPYTGFNGSNIKAVLYSKNPFLNIHQTHSTTTPAKQPI